MIARSVLAVLIAIGIFKIGTDVGRDIQDRQDTYSQVGWCMKRDKLDAYVSR